MKKVLFLLLCCSLGLFANAGPISQQEALNHAKAYLLKQGARKVLSVQPQYESLSLAYECMPKASRGAMSSNDPLYYVFNRGSEGGFIVVAGDDRMQPVMACTDNGTFDQNTENPGLQWWLEAAKQTIASIAATPDNGEKVVMGAANTDFAEEVQPLITTKWNQGYPYNLSCPIDWKDKNPNPEYAKDPHPVPGEHSATGCIATAVAQFLNYWGRLFPEYKFENALWKYHEPHGKFLNEPQKEINFYSNQEYNPFQWGKNKDVYDEKDKTKDSEESKDAVADLMFACGVAMNMDYCSKESGTGIDINLFEQRFNLDPATINLHREYFSTEEWDFIIKTELNAKRPVQYNGNVANGGGHAFICDGYKDNNLFHINWGWGGGDDGYYVLSVLNNKSEDDDRLGVPVGSGGFNYKQQIYIGKPKGCGDPLPFVHRMYYREIIDISVIDNTIKASVAGLKTDQNGFIGDFTLGLFDYQDHKLKFESNYVYRNTQASQNTWVPQKFEFNFGAFTPEVGHKYYIQPIYKQNGEVSYQAMYALRGANKRYKLDVSFGENNQVVVENNENHLAKISVVEAKLLGGAFPGAGNIFEITFENRGAMFNEVIQVRNKQTDPQKIAKENCVFEAGTTDKPSVTKIQFTVNAPVGVTSDEFKVYIGDSELPLNRSNGQPFVHSCQLSNFALEKIEYVDGFANANNWNKLRLTIKNTGLDYTGELGLTIVDNSVRKTLAMNIPVHEYKKDVPVVVEHSVWAEDAASTLLILTTPDHNTEISSKYYDLSRLQITEIVSEDSDQQIYKNHKNKLKVTIENSGNASYKGYFIVAGSKQNEEDKHSSVEIKGKSGQVFHPQFTESEEKPSVRLLTIVNGSVYTFHTKNYIQTDAPFLDLSVLENGVYVESLGDAVKGVSNELIVKVKNTENKPYKRNLNIARKKNGSYEHLSSSPVSLDGNATQEVHFVIDSPNAENDVVAVKNGGDALVKDDLSYTLKDKTTGDPNLSVTFENVVDNNIVVYEGEDVQLTYNLSNSGGYYGANITMFLDALVENTENTQVGPDLSFSINGDNVVRKKSLSAKVPLGNYWVVPYAWGLANPRFGEGPKVAVMNIHRNGDFIRVKSGANNYVTSEEQVNIFAKLKLDNSANANNIYMFNDGQFISYGNGYNMIANEANEVGHSNNVGLTQKFLFSVAQGGSNNLDKSVYFKDAGNNQHYLSVSNGVLSTTNSHASTCNFEIKPVASLPVTLRAAQEGAGAYATLFTPVALTIPTGVKAYIGKISEDYKTLTLKKIENNIPANTAVLLWSETAGVKEMPITTETVSPIPVGTNDFVGQVETKAKETGKIYLALGKGATSQKIGFYKSKATNLQGFRARLVLNSAQSAATNGFTLHIDGDDLTGVEEVEMEPEVDIIYDLSGRRIAEPGQRGVYIVNGKKVYLK